MFRRIIALAGIFGAVAAAPAAAAPPEPARVLASPADDARSIVLGLQRAARAGRLPPSEAAEYRTILRRARAVLRLLPGSRYDALARVLHDVRLQARVFTRPRALALFSMLETNADYLSTRPVPPALTDVVGGEGIVYRAGWGHGLQFHPLANTIALNAHVSAGRAAEAIRLADALLARAVPRARGAVWEYYFPFGGGRPPWASGMAQAVGAQALARAAERFGEPSHLTGARRAFSAIPGRLVRSVSTGPWVRLYSFGSLVVLNSQLQSVLSLADYARLSNDGEAAALAARLEESSRGLFSRFDTGFWSNYSLGQEAPLKYHLYHVDLLRSLSRRTGDAYWASAATRFERYTHEPPVFRPGRAAPTLYPFPPDGFRDEARISFWVSKISTVTLRIAGEQRPLGLSRRGWYTLAWRPGRAAPGTYRPVVTAVDLAGNRGTATLHPVLVARDHEPPEVTARMSGRRLVWRARDAATPWLRMTIVLERAGARKRLSLGRRPLAGTLTLRPPRGTWDAVLFAADSSGNRARVPLGRIAARR